MSRFASLTIEDIDKLVLSKDSESSNKAADVAFNILLRYCVEKNIIFIIETITLNEFNDILIRFFAEVRKEDGTFYKKTSMHTLRYGLQRKITHIRKDIDIVHNQMFKRANEVFTAQLVHLKKIGLAKIDHKPAISKNDLEALYSSGVFDINKPATLLNKVFFEIMYYLCRRGRENLRKLTKESFKVNVGDDGKKFVTLEKDELTKNHGVDVEQHEGGFMVETGGLNCPITSFKIYVSRLNPNLRAFFQRPKNSSPPKGPWYDNMVIGTKKLETLMKRISKEANLNKIYSNHSIRATAITLLDSAVVEARHIMSLSGHRAESSIRSYSKTSDEIKRKMSSTLSSASASHSSSVIPRCFNFGDELYNKLGRNAEGDDELPVHFSHDQIKENSKNIEVEDGEKGETVPFSFLYKGEPYFTNCTFNICK